MRIWLLICSVAVLAGAGCLTRKDGAIYSPLSLDGNEVNPAARSSAPPGEPALAANPRSTANASANRNPVPAPPASSTNRLAQTSPPSANPPGKTSQPVVTAAEGLAGKIASVNTAARFVVVNFP